MPTNRKIFRTYQLTPERASFKSNIMGNYMYVIIQDPSRISNSGKLNPYQERNFQNLTYFKIVILRINDNRIIRILIRDQFMHETLRGLRLENQYIVTDQRTLNGTYLRVLAVSTRIFTIHRRKSNFNHYPDIKLHRRDEDVRMGISRGPLPSRATTGRASREAASCPWICGFQGNVLTGSILETHVSSHLALNPGPCSRAAVRWSHGRCTVGPRCGSSLGNNDVNRDNDDEQDGYEDEVEGGDDDDRPRRCRYGTNDARNDTEWRALGAIAKHTRATSIAPARHQAHDCLSRA